MNSKLNKAIILLENAIYGVVVLFLLASAILLIVEEAKTFFTLNAESFNIQLIVDIIAKTLLLLMIIEILSTVRISVKEHTLCAEPFLIVGMIASIRRILIISVETAYMPEHFQQFMIEIGVLTFLIFVFIVSIVLLRKNKIK